MFNSKKANDVRTILLLKSESEIEDFTKSKMLINSISPKVLYNLYSNIEIVIKNTLEFSTKKSKENQKKFYDDSHILEQDVYTPYMDIFKKINKILISEKKNQTFYLRLDLNDKEKDKLNIENNKLSVKGKRRSKTTVKKEYEENINKYKRIIESNKEKIKIITENKKKLETEIKDYKQVNKWLKDSINLYENELKQM